MTVVPITLDAKPETLLHQVRWLLEHCADHRSVTVISGEAERSYSVGEFFHHAARYAHALDAIGASPGELVVLILPQEENALFGFWGAMLLGAVPSMFAYLTDKLDPIRYYDSVRKLVQHANARFVITDTALFDPLSAALDGLAVVISADTLQPGGDPAEYLARPLPQTDSIAFLQHSSGSTGLQKGVMLSHRAVINQLASYGQAIELAPDDVIVSWLPLYHDMGLIAAFIQPIMQAIHLVLMSPTAWVRAPQILLQAITRHRGSLVWLPNFAYNFLATRIRDSALDGIDLSSLRAVINCSEPVYAESHRVFTARFAPFALRESALMTCYAMAENTFAVTSSQMNKIPRIDRVDRRRLAEERIAYQTDGDAFEVVSCGTPIIGCQVRIVDAERQTLPERSIGEIALQSDSMLSGYHNQAEITAAALVDGWYFTGDMGYLADGELYITGRKKDLIIVGGKNIYPQDIENLLNDIPGIHPGRIVAFGVDNTDLGTQDIGILAEVDDPADLEGEGRAVIVRTIRSRIAQSTDVSARYVDLVPLRWLIKTSSGKIARAANRDKYFEAQKSP